MTPTMAAAIVRAQDVAHLQDWSEEPAERVVGWGRASLNVAGLALVPAGVDRDTTGMWTRGWSLLHTSGDAYGWASKSTSSDEARALAEAYRAVLGMSVRILEREACEPEPVEAVPVRAFGRNTGPGTSGKRPPWARIERPAHDVNADLERAAAEAPWACDVVGCDDTHTGEADAGEVSRSAAADMPHAEDAVSSAPTESAAGGEGSLLLTSPPAVGPSTACLHPYGEARCGTCRGCAAAAAAQLGGVMPALPVEVLDWSAAVETLCKDEDIDVPCRLCGEGFEHGDRYRTRAGGVEFAHSRCVQGSEPAVEAVGPAGENKPDHRSKPRHAWKGGGTCLRCGETKGAASGACPGKPAEVAAVVEAASAADGDDW